MKKRFIVVAVLLIVLLLVLRKQTEPTTLTPPIPKPKPEAPIAGDAKSPDAPKAAVPVATVKPDSPSKETARVSQPLPPPQTIEQVRSMAKSALSSGYTAQKAIQAEWARYSTDLVFLGWTPSDVDLNFKMGFLAPINEAPIDSGSLREDPSRMTTDAFVGTDTSESNQKIRYTPAAEKIRLQDYAKYCAQGCTATKETFEYLLAVPLDETRVDVWVINEKKELKLVHDGTASN